MKSSRGTCRYRLLVFCYRRGWADVPLIGPKADGKRDCAPGYQAQVDVFGFFRPATGESRLRSPVWLDGGYIDVGEGLEALVAEARR